MDVHLFSFPDIVEAQGKVWLGAALRSQMAYMAVVVAGRQLDFEKSFAVGIWNQIVNIIERG